MPPHGKRRYIWCLIVTWSLAGAALLGQFLGLAPPLLLNLSSSLPRGLYRTQAVTILQVGTLVVVPVPQTWEALAVARGYVPARVPFLKPIAALTGDHVCWREGWLWINATARVPVQETDPHGRAVPVWRDCRTLASDEVFLLSTYSEHSFDSRYFGPVSRATIHRTATHWLEW